MDETRIFVTDFLEVSPDEAGVCITLHADTGPVRFTLNEEEANLFAGALTLVSNLKKGGETL